MFSINNTIGRHGNNNSQDVRQIETLLGRIGHLDLSKTDGPTGYFGARLEQAIKSYQKDNDLKVDGRLNPGGETVVQLAKSGEISKPTKPVPPTAPSVQKPQKPSRPVVPGAPKRNATEGEIERTKKNSEKEKIRRLMENFRRRIYKDSLSR